ncbi:MAG TPA: hypothetical protein VN805_05890 [Caulobacteraceae bacterium]|nr:hypothetical protein [Caulobacteraceae bacterium]
MVPDPMRRALVATLAALAVATPAFAQAPPPPSFEGAWGGAAGDETAQVIVAGGEVIGFYWRGDYVETTNPHLSGDGRVLTFAFNGGQATLTRTGEATATIVVADAKGTVRIDLKRD